MSNKIAVVRVRGDVKVKRNIITTLRMLRLYNKNYCVLLDETPQNLGMINKVKDFITYGKVDNDTMAQLIEMRGEEFHGREKDSKGKIDYRRKYLEYNGKKYKKYFRLSPPRKGYGRKGIKKPFSNNGALGNRGEKINDLIKRMI